MKNRILFLFALFFAQVSLAQDQVKSHKIIFQLSTADTMAHKALMKQLKNIHSVSPTTIVEVVCHGPGLDMLHKDKSVVFSGIKTAVDNGVKFQACEFSLKERNIEKSSIVSIAGYVPAGIIHIVTKQEEGWAYIKAGF
jgi:intracellular sulfur oxidation DsrE/DsrF family protein